MSLPLAILDVDLTLVDNAPRTRAILTDWLVSLRSRAAAGEVDEVQLDRAIARAPTMDIVFSAQRNVTALGMGAALSQEALRFWWSRFFTPRYAMLDVPVPGSVAAVRWLREHGVTVVYLTARPKELAEATAARFVELGLPIAEVGTVLVTKDRSEEPDGEFKSRALAWIGQLGQPRWCVDNEPGHVNRMKAAFPAARCAQILTRHSPGAPARDAGVEACDNLYDWVRAV